MAAAVIGHVGEGGCRRHGHVGEVAAAANGHVGEVAAAVMAMWERL